MRTCVRIQLRIEHGERQRVPYMRVSNIVIAAAVPVSILMNNLMAAIHRGQDIYIISIFQNMRSGCSNMIRNTFNNRVGHHSCESALFDSYPSLFSALYQPERRMQYIHKHRNTHACLCKKKKNLPKLRRVATSS